MSVQLNKTLSFSVLSVVNSGSSQAPSPTSDDYDSLSAAVKKQANHVRELKQGGAVGSEIERNVQLLTELRKQLEAIAPNEEHDANRLPLNRKQFDELLLRKMFVIPGFEIYGGIGGLLDLGPPSCGLKANILDVWRKHFIVAENMLEMECTCLTPEPVFKASGHVDKFTDFMVKDVKTGECFRADKLLEDLIDQHIEHNPHQSHDEVSEHRLIQRQADAFDADVLHSHLLRYNAVSPITGNQLTAPFEFNLMFKTTIGPEGTTVGYLRPETAQGLFVNFRRLLDYNHGKMPFATAQIGLGFRNEISPRSGLLRVREFCMAEIEHFVNPLNKDHGKFSDVANLNLNLFADENQMTTGRVSNISVGEAVSRGMINNQTLAYFMSRTYLFMCKIGIIPDKMRFRQHLKSEKAHYAADCWDLEILTSYGWVECVGHADRSCYDLDKHCEHSGVVMMASEVYAEPRIVTGYQVDVNRKVIGLTYKRDQKTVVNRLEGLCASTDPADVIRLNKLVNDLNSAGVVDLDGFAISREMAQFTMTTRTIHESKYVPSVIEPSFGIGRTLYAVLEHAFYSRPDDEQRTVMRFSPLVAPIKVGIYPLLSSDNFKFLVSDMSVRFSNVGIAFRVDASSGAIGRRYSRSDEIGVPFGITIDFQTIDDGTVTLRERDSMIQVRIHSSCLVEVIRTLCDCSITWGDVMGRFPIFSQAADDDDDDNKNKKKNNQSRPVQVETTHRGDFSRPAKPIIT